MRDILNLILEFFANMLLIIGFIVFVVTVLVIVTTKLNPFKRKKRNYDRIKQ